MGISWKCFSLPLCVIGAIAVNAQVVPNSATTSEGGADFFFFGSATSSTTYQMTIAAHQLTSLVGMDLDGVEFRLDSGNSSAWPFTSSTLSQFNIFIGQGVAPSSTTSILANNFTSNPIQVRSGGLTISAGDYATSGTPKPFGPKIAFDVPYRYEGGNLTIEYRYTGLQGGAQPTNFDACWTQDIGNGTDYTSNWAPGNTSTDAIFTHGISMVTKFTTAPVPEPTGLVVLSIGGMIAMRRRKAGKETQR